MNTEDIQSGGASKSASPAVDLAIGVAWVVVYFAIGAPIYLGSGIGGQMLGQAVGRWVGPLFQMVVGVGGLLLWTWLVRVKLNKRPWAGMALPKLQVGRYLIGFALGTIAMLLVCAIEYELGWLHFARIDNVLHRGLPKAVWLLLGIASSIWVGFTEELPFRGYIFQTLAERMQTWIAALVVGLGFALVHFTLPGFGPGFIVSVVVFSTTFLAMRFATGSLWFPIGFHGAWDYTQTYVVGVSTAGQPGYDPAFVQVTQTGPTLWVGGNPSIEGGLVCMIVIVAVFVLTLIYAARTGRPSPWTRRMTLTGE